MSLALTTGGKVPNPALSVSEAVQELAREIKLPDGVTDEGLLDVVAARFHVAQASIIESSIALAIYKQRCPQGDYLKGLAQRDIAHQRASELARIGDRLMAVPRGCRLEMLAMKKSQLIALARYSVNELTYGWQRKQLAIMAQLAAPEANAWKAAYQAQLVDEEARKRGIDTKALEDEAKRAAATRLPAALMVARDELLASARRSQLELERAKQVVRDLLHAEHDAYEQARIEMVHMARQIVRAAVEDAKALDAELAARFGAASLAPIEGSYRTLPASELLAIENKIVAQAEADTNARARERNGKLGIKGAPPKSLEAVLKQVTAPDHG